MAISTTSVCTTARKTASLFFVCVVALQGGVWGGGVRSNLQLFTHTFVRIRSRHAFSVVPPEPSCGIDFRPKLVNNFDEQHSFHLSVRETGKFQGTVVASGAPPNAETDFGP
jgi:hypothetical protein